MLAYLTFTAILVVTPGATTAVVVRNTLGGGRRAGLACAAGAALANSIHATLAGLGLAVLFTHWATGLVAIRVGGAAYLAWLGAQSLWTAFHLPDGGLSFEPRGRGASSEAPAPGDPNQPPPRLRRSADQPPLKLRRSAEASAKAEALRAKAEGSPLQNEARGFREGLAINLANPAIITFYLAIVPSFIPTGAPRFYFATLAAIHVSMALVCHSMWAISLHAVRRWFAAPWARRTLTVATGVALIYLAVRVVI